MHRILNIARNENNVEDFIEQPVADCIFLTSVKADLNLLAKLENEEIGTIKNNIRALDINYLRTPSQIDHYINKTISKSKIVILRLFGDKGTWSYGLEQIRIWSKLSPNNKLLILSGTQEQDLELNELSTIDLNISIKLSILLREGGKDNYLKFLKCINLIINNIDEIPDKYLKKTSYPDPYYYDWKNESGSKVGIISYKSLFLANESDFSDQLNKSLRKIGLSPKTALISTLKSSNIQRNLVEKFKKEKIELLITTTSFDSSLKTKSKDEINKFNLFEELNLPVLQILTSNRNKKEWNKSPIGINSLDLLMQIIIPEFDGRIITIPCAFKETVSINENICCETSNYKFDQKGINWLVQLVSNYIKLKKLKNKDKKIAVVISNYPVKNSRIGNGVGLNTPNSIINILNWFKDEGYEISDVDLPNSSRELMSMLIKKRTNDPLSMNNQPLDYLSLSDYELYWNKIPKSSRNKIIKRWEVPSNSIDLEKKGFAISGLKFGNICLLIQPQRGYDSQSLKDIHSPDLPPPHRYLAQYFWTYNIFKSDAICHIGKHGTIEWLPGKSVGLSDKCFPQIICPPIPIIYPFIVNDPGEGSQSKRRTHSTIIDHLTPPLDRSELYGNLANLEKLIDEYYEAVQLNSKRIINIKNSIKKIISDEFKDIFDINDEGYIEKIDSYLCEIKENQIRVGLHTFGSRHSIKNEIDLILCLCRVPTRYREGILQFLSKQIKLDLDPWTNEYSKKISGNDKKILYYYSNKKINTFSGAIDFLETQSKYLIYYYFYKKDSIIDDIEVLKNKKFFNNVIIKLNQSSYLKKIKKEIYLPVIYSPSLEKKSLLNSLCGEFIKSGPSGAPTRGKLEVLPTGKNFFSIDTRGLPTEAAWDVGIKSANQILDLYILENGEDLKKLAISLWATSTMRNGGEDICQILFLMGIKPVWDFATRRLIDLEIIPINLLSRPRVDVTIRISGMFRDSFPQLIEILSKAINLISNLDESIDKNPLAHDFKNNKSIYRIFGSAPESYGAGLQELISNSSWTSNDDLANAYLAWSSWIYDNNLDGLYGRNELEKSLKNIQVVIHNQDNKEHDILDSDDYYQFQGGLSAAIKKISGKYPDLFHGDLSKYGYSKITKLKKELEKVVLSRVLNPKWTKGMMKNGYKGAFEFSATLDYLYAYDATTKLVSNWCYESIYKNWLCNKDIKNFLENNNPWALRDIAERFIEVINRKMWDNENKEILENLKMIVNNTESKIEKNKF